MTNSLTNRRDSTLIERLLGRRMLAVFALLLAYGGGLWIQVLHDAEGGIELGAPPPALHWLRDSTLALPLIVVAIFLGATLARRLLERFAEDASEVLVASVVGVVLALYASIVLAIGNPIHGLLFPSIHGGGHDLPLAFHIVRDGLLALAMNELLAVSLAAVVLAAGWLTPGRPLSARAARPL
jgi:hypothetical protein